MATEKNSTEVFETPVEEVVLEVKPKSKRQTKDGRIAKFGMAIASKVSPHWKAFQHYRSTDPFKKTVQSVFGFMIAIILSFIDVTRTPLGPLNFMSAVSVILLFSDTAPSASSVGSVLQNALRNSIAILFAASIVAIFLQVSFLVGNRQYISGAVILDLGLLVLTFIATYLRASEPKEWTIPMINVKMYFILCIIRGSRSPRIEEQMQLVVSLMNTFLSSFVVYLVTSLLIYPKSASKDLRLQIQMSLLNIIKMVELSTKAHNMNATSKDIDNLKDLRAHTAIHFTKLDSLLKHAKMEIRYDNLTMEELEAIANSTKKLLQHVWSMVSCNDPISGIQVSIPVYNAFIRPLRSEMQKLIEECVETLENLVTKLVTHDLRCCVVKRPDLTDSSRIWIDLSKSLEEFDLKQHLMTHEFGDSDQVWEELFHIYGYIFAYREFVMELDILVQCMNSLKRKNTLHAPTRFRLFGKNNKLSQLYEAPQKPLTTREKLWKATLNLTSFNVLFSLKTSLTIAIFAIPAFLPAYKAFYQEWRGEWALVTLAVVVIPAFGGNYMNGIWRICGTLMGAAWGMITWLAFPGDAYGMFFMMSIFSIPFFYVMQNTKYVKFAVITTLTLVIVALGKYTSGVGVGDSIYEFFYKRSLCVIIGVTISLIENRLIWPYLARRELRKQLGTSLLNISFLYSKIIAMSTTKVTSTAIEEITYLESKLQLRILKHWEQLSFAKDEPRLKGTFPSESYESLIKSVQYILDRLRVARMTVARGFGNVVLHDVIIPLSTQRKEMFLNIVLNLYILSGALISQTSLPCYLPNAAKARERFINSLRKLPVVQQGLFHNMKLDFIYYYAYTLAMKDLIHELEKMGIILKKLFGEISFTKGAFFEDINKSISKDV